MPLHELLHVLGCLASGGEVTRLELSPLYGGQLFAHIFPWVVSGGEYAGRLSGFRPAGDLSYLATVLAPHLILCPAGSALARYAVRTRRAWLFGVGLAAALQSLVSLTGDWYEAASIPLTRAGQLAGLSWALTLRGDDIFKIAPRAAAVHSVWAWALFAGGCVGGALLAAFTLIVSGGIAPRLGGAQASAGRWTRRSFMRAAIGVLSLGTGVWILKSVWLPRRLKPAEVETLRALLDTLIPDGEFAGTRRTGVLERLLPECEAQRQTRRALVEGLRLLDRAAQARGAADFVALPQPEREAVVDKIAQAELGTLPRFFYRTVRDRAMQLHYAHPVTWAPLRFSHPPQPEGHLDFWQKPDV